MILQLGVATLGVLGRAQSEDLLQGGRGGDERPPVGELALEAGDELGVVDLLALGVDVGPCRG